MREMHDAAVWAVAGLTIAAIVTRPFHVGEWVWSVLGALVLVAAGLLSGGHAAAAAADGVHVYAFLAGMLALAELARVHGIFDWLGAWMTRAAGGGTGRLFGGLFTVAIAVTALLSNDGTILLLTPVAIALARSARVPLLPFAYAVAFVANAASFVLPISNPANLVVFPHLPRLLPWLAIFAAPSAAALLCTYAVLRAAQARALNGSYEVPRARAALAPGGRAALAAVALALAVVVAAAALGWPVGYVALAAGAAAVLFASLRDLRTTAKIVPEAPWSVVPLVAGLFVIVRALDETGVLQAARGLLHAASAMPPLLGRLYAGGAVTLADAAINNLPAGVIVRYALRAHGIAPHVAHAVLVGIDLGPNLSLNASLATLLWAMTIRREGEAVGYRRFLAMGALVTIPALALALLVT